MIHQESMIKRKTKAKRKGNIFLLETALVNLSEVKVKAVKISAEELDMRREKAGVPKSKLLVP